MIRITKPTARKLFRQGKVIHLIPCKCNINSPSWKGGICINNDCKDSFDHLVMDFHIYNCNAESGYYAHYYVEEGEEK